MHGATIKKKIYGRNILRRIIFLDVSKSSDPEHLNNIYVAKVSDQDFISPVIDN
jgi:hypothetical protein